MAEITFAITRQQDGWYLASLRHPRMGGATEAHTYDALKGKMKECLHLTLNDGFGAKIGVRENPDVRLQYEETLFEHAGTESVRIVGNAESDGYGVHMRKPFPLDIHRGTVEELRDAVRQEIEQKDYHGQNIVLTLEEVLGTETLGTAATNPHST